MRTSRLYTPQSLTAGQTITVGGKTAHYVINVLRLRAGTALTIFNGKGDEYEATLDKTSRAEIFIRLGTQTECIAEPLLGITLVQGIARNDRMDLILQKAVELGVTTIQPLWMQRSQKRLKGERMEKRLRHWEGIIISACEQSGRGTLPQLLPTETFSEWMGHTQNEDLRIMLQPGSTLTLNQLTLPGRALTLLIGPEGGLSPEEQSLAESAGYQGINLGPRILRTETAGLAALAAAQTLWGDFRN